MKVLKKALICVCSLTCALACGTGVATVNNSVQASAATSAVEGRTLKIDNSARQEYWFHNDVAITEGQDFTIEFTVESISKTSIGSGLFAATGGTESAWTYNNVIATENYYTLFQNNAASLDMGTNHYRYYFKYVTSGTNAGKYEINRYVNGTHNYNNKFNAYQPYMGLYFINFNFEMTLKGVKFYQGTGDNAKDLGVYSDTEGSDFYLEDGASVRMADPTGLGFTSRVSYADYNEAVAAYGEENVSTGTLIAMASDVSASSFTHAGLNAAGVKYLDVANKGFKNADTAEADGYYAWRGSVVNLYEHNHGKNFAAVGYLCVNGEYTYTTYNAEDNSRSIRYVAGQAYNDTSDSKTGNYTNEITYAEHPNVGKYSPYTTTQLDILYNYSNISDEQKAFDILAARDSYVDVPRGKVNYVTNTNTTVTVGGLVGTGAAGNTFSGFGLSKAAVQSWVDLGFQFFTFTIGLSAEAGVTVPTHTYIYDYNEKMSAFIANTGSYRPNGSVMTIDLEELLKLMPASNPYLIFVFTNGGRWASTGAPAALTFSDISFTKTTGGAVEKPAIADNKAEWLTYNGTTDNITYADNTWTIADSSSKLLTLNKEMVAYYLDKGIGSVKFNIGWKDSKQAAMSVRVPNSSEVLLSHTGASYTANNDTVSCNTAFSVTIKLTEQMADEGLSMYVYYSDRGWSGDTAGTNGFTVAMSENMNTMLEKNWVVGQNLNVGFDGSIYVLTNANGGNLSSGYQHIGISRYMIDKMVEQGYTTLSFTFKVSGGSPYDFDVPNVDSASTVTLNITDLSSNGDAASYYNPDGYFSLRLYINNTKSSAKMYITFTEKPAETYSIVYSKSADDTEIQAANVLADYIEEATGSRYDVVSDRYVTLSDSAKYISVGQTSLLKEAGLATMAQKKTSGDGYIRRTIGNTLFIDGITERGTLYGVMDYLEDAYGYIFVADGVYTYTATSDLIIDGMDKDFTPTFDTRTYLVYGMYAGNTNATTALYNKANSYYVSESKMESFGGVDKIGYIGERDHNMYDTLVEGINIYNAAYGTSYVATDFAQAYTIGNATYYNPCLSGGRSNNNLTALDFMTLAMKNCILGQYDNGVRYYSLTQEDTNGSDYCTCAICNSQANIYGRSGLMVNFFNQLVAKLDADADMQAENMDDYRLVTFAYQYTKEAPKGGVVCNDKLVIRLAYAADDAQKGIAQNANKYLEQWSAVANELMYWGYDVDFSSYLPYYASITGAMADNVKYLKDNNVTFVMMQGAHNADNIWHSQLRAYVYSKMLYNFDEVAYSNGADAYVQSLVTEYLNVYYGEYADAVQSVITHYQDLFASKTVTDCGSSSPAALLTASNHSAAFRKVSSSYTSCTDAVMKKRLAAVLASCYAGEYEAKTYGFQKEAMKADLKAYCDEAGITQWSEASTVDAVLA